LDDDVKTDSLLIATKDKEQLLKTLDTLQIAEAFLKRDSLIMVDPKGYFEKTSQESIWTRLLAKRQFFGAAIQKDTVNVFNEISSDYGISSKRENWGAFNES